VICRTLHQQAHVTDDAVAALKAHSWPGNVRELRNVLTRAYVMGGARVDAKTLQFHSIGSTPMAGSGPIAQGTLKDAERSYIQVVLDKNDGNRSAAARELGLARSTLHYKMNKLGIR
jgi:DNA-binding NtrC family response regulator